MWNECRHETRDAHVAQLHPDGIHGAVAQGIRATLGSGALVTTATLDEPEHGLTQQVVADNDVLVWWGHIAHDEVRDDVVDRVHGSMSWAAWDSRASFGPLLEDFRRLIGTSAGLLWRNDRTGSWCGRSTRHIPSPPGCRSPIVIEQQEMYGEFFDIPAPDELVFVSSFTGGEVFRSGCTFRRGFGKNSAWAPASQDYPASHHPAQAPGACQRRRRKRAGQAGA